MYGTYWHSIPRRREGDQLKKAYWLNSGLTVFESGIPLYPSGGASAGKAVIWWDWEIYSFLDHLFFRDLPELFNSERITGEPQEYILNAEDEKLRMKAQSAVMTKSKMRPKPTKFQTESRKLRKRLFNIDKIYPFLKAQKEYAIPKVPKRIYRG